VTKDSGFGEDFISDHFVTDKEFTNVIEVIQTSEYMCEKEDPAVTTKEIKSIVLKYCEEEEIDNFDFCHFRQNRLNYGSEVLEYD
jgi:hypothetical protein